MKLTLPEDPVGRRIVLFVIPASLVLVAVSERDLRRRSDDEIRGPKRIWQVVCLNATGAIAYLCFGRRRVTG